MMDNNTGRQSHVSKVRLAVGTALGLGLSVLVLSACTDAPEVESERSLVTVTADRGEIQRVVGASGKVVPRDEVTVGAEVSGRIIQVLVDFNSAVKEGDVIAKIDPTSYQSRVRQISSRIDSALADIEVQKASIERARVSLSNAEQQLTRREGLYAQDAISQAQLEAAQRDVGIARADQKLAEARLVSSQASVEQLRAQLVEARADLDRTTIRSPIDGVVIDRKVDPGQTVQASFNAPELFAIAADLSKVRIEAIVVESDVAGLEAGDTARFTVDAYPDDTIEGIVEQLRLKSQETNNIVSYTAVIAAENPAGRLMPGMTANLQIITDIKSNARRLPVMAERYRPAPEDLAQFKRESDGDGEEAGLLAPTFARLAAIGLPESRIASFRTRIEPATQPIRDIINDPTRSFMHTPMRLQLAELIDGQIKSFLNPDERQAYQSQLVLERTIRPVDIWVADGSGGMVQKTVKLGLSDGTFVEVVDGLGETEAVVTGVRDGAAPQRRGGGGRPPGVGG